MVQPLPILRLATVALGASFSVHCNTKDCAPFSSQGSWFVHYSAPNPPQKLGGNARVGTEKCPTFSDETWTTPIRDGQAGASTCSYRKPLDVSEPDSDHSALCDGTFTLNCDDSQRTRDCIIHLVSADDAEGSCSLVQGNTIAGADTGCLYFVTLHRR